MNGRLMKMELDGNINNKENIGEISEKRLEEIKQEYPNIMQIYIINDLFHSNGVSLKYYFLNKRNTEFINRKQNTLSLLITL